MTQQITDPKQIKKTKIWYWVLTILFIVSLLPATIPSLTNNPQWYALVVTKMGYPAYFIPFTGYAKILGAIAILIPGFPTIKEWAYAGMVFDLVGVTYSSIAIGESASHWSWMGIWFVLFAGAYFFYRKKLQQQIG